MKKIIFTALFIIAWSVQAFAADTLTLTLQNAIDTAMKNNPALKKVIYAEKQAQAQLNQAKSGNYPTVSLNLNYNPSLDGGYYFFNNSSNGTTITNISYGIDASYTLFDGGAIVFSIKQAETALTEADCNFEKQKQSLKYDTTKAYYDVINCANQVKVQETALYNASAHLKVVQTKFEDGFVPKGDVLSAQVTVSSCRQSLIVAKNSYNKAMLSLKNIMNIPAQSILNLTATFDIAQKIIDQKQTLSYAAANNPDIQLAKLAIESDDYNHKIAEAGNYPVVTLGASGSQGFNQNVGQTYSNSLTFGLSAGVSFNLFDGYNTKNKIDAAALQTEQEKQALDSVILSTNLDVSSAIDDISAAQEVINAAKSSLDYAQEDLEIKQVRYESGVGTNIDVLDAQSALTSNQTTYWEAVYKYNLALAYLDKAIGVPVK